MKRTFSLLMSAALLASTLSAIPAAAVPRMTTMAMAPLKLLKPAEPLPVDNCTFFLTQHWPADPDAVHQLLPKAQISYQPERRNWKQMIVRYDTQVVTLTRQTSREQVADQKNYYLELLPRLDQDRNLAVTRDLGRKASLIKQTVSVSSLDSDDPEWPKLISGLAQLWHGTVLYRDELLDTRLRVLLARRDDWEDDSTVPYFPSALARRARTERLLTVRKLPIYKNLAPIVTEEELQGQAARQVMERALTLLVLASTSTTLTRPEAADMLMTWGLLHELTPSEKAYLTKDEPSDEEIQAVNLRFEAAYALLWALGVAPKTTFPGKPSDLLGLIQRVKSRSFRSWFDHAKLRPSSQILDQLDLAYRVSWAKKSYSDLDYKPLRDLQSNLVHEWYHSLSWLVARKGWDQVKTEY
ncbi:MAG: DUF4272 domain-containing protein [Candidatus Sericytochromatia bacterium]